MKTQRKQVPSKFGATVSFKLRPVRGVVPADTVRLRFHALQDRLVEQMMAQSCSLPLRTRLEQAAHEAAALAWLTPYPLLFLPVLFEEKALEARLRLAKQERVEALTEPLLEALVEPRAGASGGKLKIRLEGSGPGLARGCGSSDPLRSV